MVQMAAAEVRRHEQGDSSGLGATDTASNDGERRQVIIYLPIT